MDPSAWLQGLLRFTQTLLQDALTVAHSSEATGTLQQGSRHKVDLPGQVHSVASHHIMSISSGILLPDLSLFIPS